MIFLGLFCIPKTVDVVQSVRTSDCGSEGRGFEPHLPPKQKRLSQSGGLFCLMVSLPGSPFEQSGNGNPIFHIKDGREEQNPECSSIIT